MHNMLVTVASIILGGLTTYFAISYAGDVFTEGSDSANATTLQTQMSQIASAMDLYATNNNGNKITNSAFSELTSGDYLEDVPDGPDINSNNASAGYYTGEQADLSAGTEFDVIFFPMGTHADAAGICAKLRSNAGLASTIPQHDGTNDVSSALDGKYGCFQEDGTTAVVTNSATSGYVGYMTN